MDYVYGSGRHWFLMGFEIEHNLTDLIQLIFIQCAKSRNGTEGAP